MAVREGQEQGATLPPEFVTAHQAVLSDTSTQFTLTTPPTYTPPKWAAWIEPIAAFFEAIGPYAGYIFWGFLAVVVGVILFTILREMGYVRWPWQTAKPVAPDSDWTPDIAPARALLAQADALAAAGEFEQAAHLLLLRSVEDIERQRPNMLKPSSTAREIATDAALPTGARTMFALIARHVETSLFGGQTLDASHWQMCRNAYGRFALAGDQQ